MIYWGKRGAISPGVDLHSHLIPGIDDGVSTVQESIELIRKFQDLGYHKAITTPHIHPNYPNTPTSILEGLQLVQKELKDTQIQFELEAAAEYFVDEFFYQRVKSGAEILSFGNRYVLVESSFVNKPIFFEECLFELKSRGYQPILAHPERYRFLDGSIEWLQHLNEMGIYMQATIGSFAGFYGETPKEIAKRLYKNDLIDFLGSDMHHISHMKFLSEGLQKKDVKKLNRSGRLKNESLR